MATTVRRGVSPVDAAPARPTAGAPTRPTDNRIHEAAFAENPRQITELTEVAR
ncbi:hypothetical protein [Nocardia salmonicida]|uniref:hypothetical protein n=1 Tax=Nocardia salmonicida TaxID=53431 RepID=UPI0037903555